MSWWNHSKEHSDARKGIKSAKPKIHRGTANQDVIKHKLSNNLNKNITAVDRLLRKVANLEDPRHIQKNLAEAERKYKSLSTKIENHKKKYGNLPDWIQYDWVHKETFTDNSKIYKQIQKMKNMSGKELKKEQRNMWNLIVLKTERRR